MKFWAKIIKKIPLWSKFSIENEFYKLDIGNIGLGLASLPPLTRILWMVSQLLSIPRVFVSTSIFCLTVVRAYDDVETNTRPAANDDPSSTMAKGLLFAVIGIIGLSLVFVMVCCLVWILIKRRNRSNRRNRPPPPILSNATDSNSRSIDFWLAQSSDYHGQQTRTYHNSAPTDYIDRGDPFCRSLWKLYCHNPYSNWPVSATRDYYVHGDFCTIAEEFYERALKFGFCRCLQKFFLQIWRSFCRRCFSAGLSLPIGDMSITVCVSSVRYVDCLWKCQC